MEEKKSSLSLSLLVLTRGFLPRGCLSLIPAKMATIYERGLL